MVRIVTCTKYFWWWGFSIVQLTFNFFPVLFENVANPSTTSHLSNEGNEMDLDSYLAPETDLKEASSLQPTRNASRSTKSLPKAVPTVTRTLGRQHTSTVTTNKTTQLGNGKNSLLHIEYLVYYFFVFAYCRF